MMSRILVMEQTWKLYFSAATARSSPRRKPGWRTDSISLTYTVLALREGMGGEGRRGGGVLVRIPTSLFTVLNWSHRQRVLKNEERDQCKALPVCGISIAN